MQPQLSNHWWSGDLDGNVRVEGWTGQGNSH